MSETLEYIDAYFNKALDTEQQKQFEARCSSDKGFAEDVAFYVMARSAAREALLEQKQKEWMPAAAPVKNLFTTQPVKKSVLLRLVPYASAACLVFAIAFYYLFSFQAPQRLASNYMKKNYSEIKNTMDASRDSVELGISEYNNKKFQHALILFEGIRTRDSANNYYAREYAGLCYFQIKDYDKALQRFGELSAMKNLKRNSGDILQAATLLQRNAPGDKKEALELLKKVVSKNEDGSKDAKEMLDKW